jgi:hypothetical protein
LKKEIYYVGRSDGLGNRIEEIICLEAFFVNSNVSSYYIWNNQHSFRRYPILLKSKSLVITEQLEVKKGLTLMPSFSWGNLKKEDILKAARNIKPSFDINFPNEIKPIGIHIRGTDRIGKDHPHFMKNKKELYKYLNSTAYYINKSGEKDIFICSEDSSLKKRFLEQLKKDIKVIEPVVSKDIPSEYLDFFSLSKCKEIYMTTKFSTFSIGASLIGNIPIHSFYYDEKVLIRYKANFEYKPLINSLKLLYSRFFNFCSFNK